MRRGIYSNVKPRTSEEEDDSTSEYNSDRVCRSEELEAPIVFVRFERKHKDDIRDYFEVKCSHCCGDNHYHLVGSHPRVTMGGISPARCRQSNGADLMMLVSQGIGAL